MVAADCASRPPWLRLSFFCALALKDHAVLPALTKVCTIRLCAAASRGACAVPVHAAFKPCRLVMRRPGRCSPCVSPRSGSGWHLCALALKDLAVLPALAGGCTARLCAAASRGACAVPAHVAFTPCRLVMRPPGRCSSCISPAVARAEHFCALALKSLQHCPPLLNSGTAQAEHFCALALKYLAALPAPAEV